MQTWVPHTDILRVVRVLDNRRLFKQLVECKQMLLARIKMEEERETPGTWPKIGWAHHPATRMWIGHERALAHYMDAVFGQVVKRGHWDVKASDYFRVYDTILNRFGVETMRDPDWWGGPIHYTHRVSLCRKDWAYYSRLFPDVLDTDALEPDEGGVGYFWPVKAQRMRAL